MQEEYEPPVIMSPPLYSAPEKMIELILDPFKVIERVRHDLKGEVLATDGKTWLKYGKRVMNDKGIGYTVSILNKYVNRNTILSNLEETEIYSIIRNLDKNLADVFSNYHEDFGLDMNLMTMVKDGIVDMVFMALKQSKNKTLLDALTKAYSVREDIGRDRKRGIGLGSLNPFKGRGE